MAASEADCAKSIVLNGRTSTIPSASHTTPRATRPGTVSRRGRNVGDANVVGMVAVTSRLLAEQALRTDQQDEQQDESDGDAFRAGELRDERTGEGLQQPDQDPADEGTRQARDPPEH